MAKSLPSKKHLSSGKPMPNYILNSTSPTTDSSSSAKTPYPSPTAILPISLFSPTLSKYSSKPVLTFRYSHNAILKMSKLILNMESISFHFVWIILQTKKRLQSMTPMQRSKGCEWTINSIKFTKTQTISFVLLIHFTLYIFDNRDNSERSGNQQLIVNKKM